MFGSLPTALPTSLAVLATLVALNVLGPTSTLSRLDESSVLQSVWSMMLKSCGFTPKDSSLVRTYVKENVI